MRLTDIAQTWLKEALQHGDSVIDATLGNGHDALFLAQHIGHNGHLYGFDIQPQAIEQSNILLHQQPCATTFYLKGHQHLSNTLPSVSKGKISVIMFNLGWLPNSDKSIITRAETTILALQQSLLWLKVSGRLSVMVYPGHKGGDSEAQQVMTWLEKICSQHQALTLHTIKVANRDKAPILLQVEKHGCAIIPDSLK